MIRNESFTSFVERTDKTLSSKSGRIKLSSGRDSFKGLTTFMSLRDTCVANRHTVASKIKNQIPRYLRVSNLDEALSSPPPL